MLVPADGLPAILVHSADRVRLRAFRTNQPLPVRFEAQFGTCGADGTYIAPSGLTPMGIDRIVLREASGKILATLLVQMEPRTQSMFPDQAPPGAIFSKTRHAPAPGIMWPMGILPVRDVRPCPKLRIAGVSGRELPLRAASEIRVLAIGGAVAEWTLRKGLGFPPRLTPTKGSVKTVATAWIEDWKNDNALAVNDPAKRIYYFRYPASRVRYLDRFVADGRRWRHVGTTQESIPGWFAFGFAPAKDESGRDMGRVLGYDARGRRWMPEDREARSL